VERYERRLLDAAFETRSIDLTPSRRTMLSVAGYMGGASPGPPAGARAEGGDEGGDDREGDAMFATLRREIQEMRDGYFVLPGGVGLGRGATSSASPEGRGPLSPPPPAPYELHDESALLLHADTERSLEGRRVAAACAAAAMLAVAPQQLQRGEGDGGNGGTHGGRGAPNLSESEDDRSEMRENPIIAGNILAVVQDNVEHLSESEDESEDESDDDLSETMENPITHGSLLNVEHPSESEDESEDESDDDLSETMENPITHGNLLNVEHQSESEDESEDDSEDEVSETMENPTTHGNLLNVEHPSESEDESEDELSETMENPITHGNLLKRRKLDAAALLESAMKGKPASGPSGSLPCAICFDPGADHAYFPCRHLCVCENCCKMHALNARRNKASVRCPVCNKTARYSKKMFL
jgi:hypothetical protein